MNRNLAAIIGSFAFAGLVGMTLSDEPPAAAEKQPPSFWMKKKLEYSGRILAGLAREDFDQIRQNAEAMNKLGQMEEWVRAHGPIIEPNWQSSATQTNDLSPRRATRISTAPRSPICNSRSAASIVTSLFGIPRRLNRTRDCRLNVPPGTIQ